jgi:hypothetical protein
LTVADNSPASIGDDGAESAARATAANTMRATKVAKMLFKA